MVNAHDIVEREIQQELTRHGLWVGGRKCSCRSWEYKSSRGQARATYVAMVMAHNAHVAKVITKRLLDCSGLPSNEFLARSGSNATEDVTNNNIPCAPHAAAKLTPARESFVELPGDEKKETFESNNHESTIGLGTEPVEHTPSGSGTMFYMADIT